MRQAKPSKGILELAHLIDFVEDFWCGWRGSNPRPLASEANTLSTELQPRGGISEEMRRIQFFRRRRPWKVSRSRAISVPKQVLWVYNRGFGECLHIFKQAGLAGSFENCIKEIMSDAHNEHESAIRTPKQLVAAVAGFFLVTVIGIILLVSFVTTTKLTGAGTESQSAEAIAARVRPVADEGYTLKDVERAESAAVGRSRLHRHLRRLPHQRRRRRAEAGRCRRMGATHCARLRHPAQARDRRHPRDAGQRRQS